MLKRIDLSRDYQAHKEEFLHAIEEVCERYFNAYTDEEIISRKIYTRMSPFLMRRMVKSKRYAGLRLSNYVDEVDLDSDIQISGIQAIEVLNQVDPFKSTQGIKQLQFPQSAQFQHVVFIVDILKINDHIF